MQAAQAARKSPAPGTEPGSRATDQSHLNYTPDLSEAERFLLLLDEDAEVFTFQTFDDDKDRRDPRLAIIRRGTLEQHADEFTRMQARGAGIFVAVQEMDGSGRNNAAVSRIRAVFVEDDGDGAGAMFPLEPSIIVESSPGKRHCYFLADGLTPGDFAGVQARLIQDFGSDPNAKDLARVLRLPGFWHLKNPANPHKVRILQESGAQPYSRETVLAAFPPLAQRTQGEQRQESDGIAAVDVETYRDLRSALLAMRADDRDLWQRMGHALKTLGEQGRGLWLEWSATSEKFDAAAEAATWESFHPTATDYRAVFAEAQRRGWVNPRSQFTQGEKLPAVLLKDAFQALEIDLRAAGIAFGYLAAGRPFTAEDAAYIAGKCQDLSEQIGRAWRACHGR